MRLHDLKETLHSRRFAHFKPVRGEDVALRDNLMEVEVGL